MDNKLK